MASTDPEVAVERLTFLGTGTSSQVPVIGCLTNASLRCRVCPSALSPHAPGRRNRRRNTSAVLQLTNGRTILIDCGKSFFDAALELWPRAGLRRIDALLLTHAHADAVLGLDDLRGWTLGKFVQDSIDVYCSASTFKEVARMFPYLVDRGRATGGGDVPQFSWHELPDAGGEFEIPSAGCRATAVPVHHGHYFDADRTPFLCNAYKIADVTYMSDASAVPPQAQQLMQGTRTLVLDGLKFATHASHFSIQEALDFVESLHEPEPPTAGGNESEPGMGSAAAAQTASGTKYAASRPGAGRQRQWHGMPAHVYMLDFTHDVDHAEVERYLNDWSIRTSAACFPASRPGDADSGEGGRTRRKVEAKPAYDGLQVVFQRQSIDRAATPAAAATPGGAANSPASGAVSGAASGAAGSTVPIGGVIEEIDLLDLPLRAASQGPRQSDVERDRPNGGAAGGRFKSGSAGKSMV